MQLKYNTFSITLFFILNKCNFSVFEETVHFLFFLLFLKV